MINKKEKLKEILVSIEKYNILFIKDIPAVSGIGIASIYRIFPIGSKAYAEIVKAIYDNRSKVRMGLLKKWYESDNATVQIALFKMIGTEEQRKKLCSTYVEVKDDTAKDSITLNKNDVSIIVRKLKDE